MEPYSHYSSSVAVYTNEESLVEAVDYVPPESTMNLSLEEIEHFEGEEFIDNDLTSATKNGHPHEGNAILNNIPNIFAGNSGQKP